jgi:hypothetical protein
MLTQSGLSFTTTAELQIVRHIKVHRPRFIIVAVLVVITLPLACACVCVCVCDFIARHRQETCCSVALDYDNAQVAGSFPQCCLYFVPRSS